MLHRLVHQVRAGRRVVVCDASMTELIRPALYGAYHHIVPTKDSRPSTLVADVVGPVCETGDYQALEIQTDRTGRRFDVHQVRLENEDGDWRSLRVNNMLASKADFRVQTTPGFESVEVSSLHGTREFDMEFHRYRSKKLQRQEAGQILGRAGAFSVAVRRHHRRARSRAWWKRSGEKGFNR